jgi:hypothetical protein
VSYSIFDAGNLVASFDAESEARAALDRLVAMSARGQDRLLLVALDGAGAPAADCTPGEPLVTTA